MMAGEDFGLVSSEPPPQWAPNVASTQPSPALLETGKNPLVAGVNPLLPSPAQTSSSALAAKRMVLDRIASGEAPNYTTIYKGGQFTDFSDHPRQKQVISEGPHAGETSDAAGRYQFLSSTWDAQKAKLGLKDFSPASQDAAAWDLAQSTYKTATGRDLLADAQAGKVDYTKLAGQWSSLAGGGAGGDWKATARASGLTDEQIASLSPAEVAQFQQFHGSLGKGQGGSAGAPQGTPAGTPAGTSPGGAIASPAELFAGEAKLQLLRGMFPQHNITPVDYDPYKLLPKGQGGPVDVNKGVTG